MLDERQTDRTDENSWGTVWSRTRDRRKSTEGVVAVLVVGNGAKEKEKKRNESI